MKGWKAVLGAAGAIAIAYFLVARLGLALLLARSDVAVFWPASGLAAGILIVAGRRAVPAVLMGVVVGTVAADLSSDSRNLLTSLLNGTWNAGETLLAAWLLERWFSQPFTFGDLRHVAGFLVAAGLATAVSGVWGAATMTLLHPETIAPYWDVWREWFLSSWVGLVVVGPLVIGAAQTWRKPPPRKEWIEGMGALAVTAVACSYTMTQATGSWVSFSPGAFVLPLLLWLTARCQPTFAIAGAFFASVAIICAMTFGLGRFGDAAVPITHRVAGAQLAMMTVTLFTLVLAALFARRKEAEERLAKERAMLARLHEVGSRLWRTRDLHQALDGILGGAIELLGADMGVIRLLDTTREVLKVEAHRGLSQEFLESFGELPATANSACGKALRSGKRRVVDDVEADALYAPLLPFARKAGYRAAQATPIMSREDMPLGLLSTHYRAARRHTARDLLLLDLYVRQAADIIERHRAEDALRESEERLRLAQLKTGIGVWDRDLRTGKITVTPEHEALLGSESRSVKCYADFRAQVHPDDIARYEAERDAAVRRRSTFEIEYRIIRPDGQVRWLVTRGGASYDEVTGEPIRLVGNDADITERKTAELALAERNAQLLLAGKDAGVGCYANNIKTGALAVTEGYVAIHGLPEGTTQTTLAEWRTKVHPDDLARFDERRGQIFDSRCRDYMFDYRIIRDGGIRWIESRGFVSYDNDGRPQHVIGINIDITERKEAEIVLAERNAQLELASKTARVGTFVMDFHTGIVKLSPGCASIFGLPESTAEISREYGLTLVHPEDLPRHALLRDQAFLNQKPELVAQYRIRRVNDGEIRWMEVRGLNFYGPDGKPSRAIAIIIDFTERKMAEEMLAERNLQLEMAGRVGLVGSYAYDARTERLQISPGYAAIYGIPSGTTEITYREWLAYVHREDADGLQALRSETFRERRGEYKVDYRIVRRDGETRWIESRGFILYGADAREERVIGANIDVTERKRAELVLAERNAQLALASRAARVGFYANNLETGLITVSEGYAAIHGLHEGTAQTTLSQWRTRVHPDDLAPFDELRERLFGNRQHDYTFDYRIIRDDGKIRWIESRGCVSYDEDGKPKQCVGINTDITERKEHEDHKTTLISELDHRVKNVLALVSSVASQTQETSGSMGEFVAALDGRIKAMAITHELLSSRHWQGIPLAELVRRELAPYATDNNTRIAGPDVVLSADAGQTLAMVFHEFATNAAKFGAISVKTGRVLVRWSFKRNKRAESWLRIQWQERGGPQVVPPTRSGFGTSLLRELIPYELGGIVESEYPREGFRCQLKIPARWLAGM
jgi:PAS domain S-box-containing protein